MIRRARGWGGALLLAAVSGCGTSDAMIYANSSGAGGEGGSSSSDGGGGGEGGKEGCEGECVALGPLEWNGPGLLWIGEPGKEPDCPEAAPIKSAPVYAELDAASHCGACKCGLPHGSCALPATMTAAAATCASDGAGVAHTAFDPPGGWSGGCNAAGAIPANQKCNGVNCVQSLTIAPLTIHEEPCGVSSSAPAETPPVWGLAALSCRGLSKGNCESAVDICAPAAAPGFLQCITQSGIHDCFGLYTGKHVFYEGLEDSRSCTPCSCGAPTGSTCTSYVTVYKDNACSVPAVSAMVDTTGPVCIDVSPSGQALGSKLAEEPLYAHGSCQASGGDPQGEAVPVNPVTYCCLE